MNGVKKFLSHKAYHVLLHRLLPRIPTRKLQELLVEAVLCRVSSLEAAEGLRFLFHIDAALYPIKGQLAITYEGGLHPKHRHTRYHDFFVKRIHSGERVLDIGCGNGALAYDVAEKAGARVTGIDLNPDNIRQASERYAHPHIEYRVGNALHDLPAEVFDVVILSNVLEHLPERVQFLQRVQLYNRSSRILIRVPMFERDWQVPLKQELDIEWRLDPTHETEYTLESFADEIARARLKINYQEIRWGEIWAEVIPYDCKSECRDVSVQ